MTSVELQEGPCGLRVVNKGENGTSWCSSGKQNPAPAEMFGTSHPTMYNPCAKRGSSLRTWVERMTVTRPMGHIAWWWQGRGPLIGYL